MGRETLLLPPPPPPPPQTPSPTLSNPLPPPPPPVTALVPFASVSAPSSSASTSAAPSVAPTSLAPGFRFHPTDEELVIYYLKRKVCGKSFRFDAISEVDIYKSEPWDLSDKSKLKTRDQEWYFFSALDKKYGNGGRMNRATNKGYWKATGNDRPVKHDQRTVGLKKTLVFHSGRAPDGKRTNWVMHEYRLVEEELERARAGSSQPQDAYVLCRVFHKNNIGPPNGQRYAPFVEEEWDDERGLVPGAEPAENITIAQPACAEGNGRVLCIEGRNDVAQDNISDNKVKFDVTKLPIETQSLLAVCKRERLAALAYCEKHPRRPNERVNCESHVDRYPSPQNSKCYMDDHSSLQNSKRPVDDSPSLQDSKHHIDDYPSVQNSKRPMDDSPSPQDLKRHMDNYPSPQADNPKPVSQIYKRRKHISNTNHTNVNGDTVRPSKDPACQSTAATAATTLPAATASAAANTAPKKHFLSALVEFSLMESRGTKETPAVQPPEFDPDTLEESVPPSCAKYIKHLQGEISKLSEERETMRFEMMSAQAMINMLQSRVGLLSKENEVLKRMVHHP